MTSAKEFVRQCPKCQKIRYVDSKSLYPKGVFSPEVFLCCGEIPPKMTQKAWKKMIDNDKTGS